MSAASSTGFTGAKRLHERAHDLYPTPACAVRALLENWTPPQESIWECAAGEGHITRVLEAAGHQVIESDLVEHRPGLQQVDFLDLLTEPNLAEVAITNPPFKLLTAFLAAFRDRGLKAGAFLCPIHGLTSGARTKILRSMGIPQVLMLTTPSPQLSLEGKWSRGSMLNHCWLILNRDFTGYPTLRFIDHDGRPE